MGDRGKESEQSVYSYLLADLRMQFRFREKKKTFRLLKELNLPDFFIISPQYLVFRIKINMTDPPQALTRMTPRLHRSQDSS